MRAALAGWVASFMAASVMPAAADWQYTQWGMSPAQVVTASDGAARANADRGLDAADLSAELVAPYQAVSLPFTAVFLFDSERRLETVSLSPEGKAACPVIAQALFTKYGVPGGLADMVQARTMRWDDTENDNLVVYLDLGAGNCSVQFSPLPPTRPNGRNL